MKAILKNTVCVLLSVSVLLSLSACGDGPIMKVIEDESSVAQRPLPPREGAQRWTETIPRAEKNDSAELLELKTLVDEKLAQLERTADKAYISNSKYYMLLSQQLKIDSEAVLTDIDILKAYEAAPTQQSAPDDETQQPAMTKVEYTKASRLAREKLLGLWGEIDDIITRFNDYMTIMNALVNHNGVLGLISNINELTWEGTFPTGYFFNDDIPDEDSVTTLLDGSKYVKEFGVPDGELYALCYGSADEQDTLKVINAMRVKGVLTSMMTEEDGLQWYGSWVDTGGRTCYYFIWYKEGGLGSLVEKFIGQSSERIIVAGSFDFMTCVKATLGG